MISQKQLKSSNFVRILFVLKHLRDSGQITVKEYTRAKKYYQRLTGADIVIAD